ncbi:hypothetical protein [Pseudomonas schmalbachii]
MFDWNDLRFFLELHRSGRLRLVWDFLLELCAREQGLLLNAEGQPGLM